MKRLMALLAALALTLTLTVSAGASGVGDEGAEQARREEAIRLLGGTVGQVNVLLGDRCIAFGDAAPELRNDRTMVPLRAALEALGASVDYDGASGSVIVTGGKASFTHRIGSSTIELRDGTTVQMDTQSYLTASNRTMVPVRVFSQVLGYDVFWDGDYKLVFLLERESMTRAVDGSCTLVNDRLGKAAERFAPAQSYREEMTLSGEVKAADAAGTVRSYGYSGRARALVGAEAMRATLEMERGALLAWLETATGTALPAQYRALLADGTMELICGEKVYARSALLDESASVDGAWYVINDTPFAALRERGRTLGSLCYGQMLQGGEAGFFERWSKAGLKATLLSALLSDERCERSDDGCRWSFDLAAPEQGADESIAQVLRALGVEELRLDLMLYADGSAEAAYSFAQRGSDGTVRRESAALSDSQAATHYSRSVVSGGVASSCEVRAARSAADEIPAAAPEEGARIIDLTAAP